MGHSLYRALAVALLIGLASLGCQSTNEEDGNVVTVDPEVMTADGGGMQRDAAPPEGLGIDEDGDGLDGPAEATAGTDPAVADTDGDGYSDGDEVHAGTVPTDPNSVIYTGGWPYNRHKDDLEGPDWDTAPAIGTMMPRYRALDQYGDTFDLYDLHGLGKPVVMDVGTWFCEPCKALADFFTHGDMAVMDAYGWWRPEYAVVREMIENDEIVWLTVLYSGSVPVTQEDVTRWHDTWPHDKIIVLADAENQLQEYLSVRAMPRIDVLDGDLNFTVYYPQGPALGMRTLAGLE